MNKQEAIERMKREQFQVPYGPGIFVHAVFADKAIELINQIHEPQKVVLPEFIDSYIRYAKAEGMSLFIAMDNAQNKESEWIIANEETFARAWFDGYGVEEEKLYTVEIPNPNKIGNGVNALMTNGFRQVIIKKEFGNDWKKEKGFQLTEEEIKQDFEWAWQFAKEVE